MSTGKKLVQAALVLLLGMGAAVQAAAQVIRHPSPQDKLEDRWTWGIKRGHQQTGKGFWIGYSVQKRMYENAYFIVSDKHTFSGQIHFPYSTQDPTLEEILTGKSSLPLLSEKEQIKQLARRALQGDTGPRRTWKKVEKEVALLFLISGKGTDRPETVRVSNITVPFNPAGFPIVWLGSAPDRESVPLVWKIYKSIEDLTMRKRMLTVIGAHDDSGIVVPLLAEVIRSGAHEQLRARAASELEDHPVPQVLTLLEGTAMNDPSMMVRKRATYSLGDLEMEGAVDALIRLARKANRRDIRKYAITSLGEKASRKAVEGLEDIVYNDPDVELQKRAVYALEDLPDNQGLPYLIQVAKSHHHPTVRKAAIYCLGDTDDPRSLKALIEIIKK